MGNARKPCRGCGGEKEPGVNYSYCGACRAERAKQPLCALCREQPKQPGIGHRYCAECAELRKWRAEKLKKVEQVNRRKPCARCYGPKGAIHRGIYCLRCREERKLEKRPVCECCNSNPVDGPRKKLCADCRQAARERQRARERAHFERCRVDPEWRERERKRQLAEYHKIMADPVRKEKYREAQRIGRHLRRERQGGELRILRPPTPVWGKRDSVPSKPAAEAFYRHLAKLQAEGESVSVETLAETLGTVARRIAAWRSGSTANPILVEQVLMGLDLEWWEIYTPETVPDPEEFERVARILGGVGAMAA